MMQPPGPLVCPPAESSGSIPARRTARPDHGLALASPAGAGIFHAWLSSTDDGAVAVDPDGFVVLHNAAASRVTGLAPESALRRPWHEVLHLDPPVAEALWRARDHAEGVHLVADILCAQGNLRTAEVSASRWRDDRGNMGVLVLIRDLATLCRQRTAPGGRVGYGALVGAHPAMQALYDLVDVVAPSDAPVLIEGEAGAGKELVAQLLHARSRRAERPLIVVNCATLGPELLERELFGQVRGGNGAAGTAIGRVELAHTGTLLLDEVAAAPAAAQAKLLRLVESGMFERLGEPVPRRIDARIVATSSLPLEREVQAGRFREDLLYRLKVVRLVIPPLRQRTTDIPALAEHFLARHGATGAALSPAALGILQAYAWPGNVRELENAIRHAAALWRRAPNAGPIGPELLPAEIRERRAPVAAPATAHRREDRRSILLRALSSHGGNRTAAARSLGIGRATFYRWWREAGLGNTVL